MTASICGRCSEHPPLSNQRWCKNCFRRYRQAARAKQREARQKAKTSDIAPNDPVESPSQPPLRLIIRFGAVRLCLLPAQEDVAVLKRLDSGPHQGLVFIQREGR